MRLYNLENKINICKEEKEFLSKEIKNATQYNLYLKNQLEILEKNPVANQTSFINTEVNETAIEPADITAIEMDNQIQNKIKLENYLTRNEEIITNKLIEEERKLRDKYKKMKLLASFENPVFETLDTKFKDYASNIANSKISNQEVFFNTSRNESNINSNIVNTRKFQYDLGLSKNDKKEVLKQFLEDKAIKRFVYDLIYE